MDPVDPHVHVVGPGQRTLVERGGLVLPLNRQPGDRRGRQPGTGADELLQRRPEIVAGQAVQVQQRQHLRDLRGLARPRRQDRRGEPHPIPGLGVDAPIVHARLLYRHRTRRRGHLPRLVVAVAHHQPVPVLVDLARVGLDVGGDLGLQRRREHRPGAITHDLVQQRPADPSRGVSVGLVLLVGYLEHGRTFPNQRVNAGPDQTASNLGSSSGRRAPSRHLAQGHPQVLMIASSRGDPPRGPRHALHPRPGRARPSRRQAESARPAPGGGEVDHANGVHPMLTSRRPASRQGLSTRPAAPGARVGLGTN